MTSSWVSIDSRDQRVDDEAADWLLDEPYRALVDAAIDDLLPRSANLRGLANPVPPEQRERAEIEIARADAMRTSVGTAEQTS